MNGKKTGRPKTTPLEKIAKKLAQPEAAEALVENAAKAGLTDEQLAALLGTTENTINLWKHDPIFLLALKRGKDEADDMVEASLFVRARGYTYTEETVEPKTIVQNVDGKDQSIILPNQLTVTKRVTKHVPADATAMIFWLKNRRTKDWRDRREITGADGEPLSLKVVMPEKYPIKQLPIGSDN